MAHDLRPIDDDFLRSAPTVASVSVELPNRRQEVWDALGSDRMWSWVPVLDRLRWLTPRGEGGVRQLRIAKILTVDEEFYRWDEPYRATFRVVRQSRPLLKGLAEDFVLDELPGGGTRLTWTMAMDGKLPSPPVGLVAKANRPALAGIRKIL
jgi:hypothetical protein